MKTRVLFLSNIPTPYQLDFNRAAQKYFQFKSVFLWPGEKNNFQWQKLKENNEIKILGFRQSIFSYKKFYTIFNDLSPQVLMIGGYKLPLTFFALFLAKLKKCPVIFWLERPNDAGKFKSFFKNILIRIKLRQALGILAIGGQAVKIYKKFHKTVINFPYSMDLSKYYLINRRSSLKIKFLYSGRLVALKNVENIIKALQSLPHQDITLNIVGSGSDESRLRRLACNDFRVNFLGFIQPDKLVEIYKQNDILLIPSRSKDGWALVINEAMAAAMPIIGTDKVGAVNEFIKHRKNGFVCGTEASDIRAGMEYYIKHKNLIDKHGALNRKLIKNSNGNIVNSVRYLKEIIESIPHEKK